MITTDKFFKHKYLFVHALDNVEILNGKAYQTLNPTV